MNNKKYVLITGGAGFIGSHIAEYFLQNNEYIPVIIDDLSGGYESNIPKDAIFHKSSILERSLINDLFEEYNFDIIFHFAAYAAENLSHYIREYNYRVNVEGSMVLINAAIKNKTKHFVFASSAAVYGKNNNTSEDTIPSPIDPYGVAKLTVEKDLALANRTFGLNYTIVRLHNVYGERQNIHDPYRNVIGIFLRQILLNKPMTVFGNGKQKRSFTYIKDIISNLCDLPFNPKTKDEILNMGTDKSHSINELVEIICECLKNKNPLVTYLPERDEAESVILSHTKYKKLYPDQKETNLKTGINNMFNSIEQNVLNPTPFPFIELKDELPDYWKKL